MPAHLRLLPRRRHLKTRGLGATRSTNGVERMDSILATIILAPIVLITINALALPFVLLIANAWTWLYTKVAAQGQGAARRSELLSSLEEATCSLRASGYKPPEIAVHLVIRLLVGLKSDVAWFALYLPMTLAERLVKGSAALSHARTPVRLISSVGALGLMNWFHYMSEDELTRVEWLSLNIGLVAVIAVMWNEHRPWARLVIRVSLGLSAAIMVGVLVWVALQYRLYEIPLFYQYVLAMAPGPLVIGVASKECRSRFFKGRWWPVFACWALIAAISLGIAVLTQGLKVLLSVWAMVALVLLSLSILCGLAAIGALLLWFIGTRGSAGVMRVLAAGIRRLQRRGTQDSS